VEYTLENLHKLIQTIRPDNPDKLSNRTIDSWILEANAEKETIQLRLMQDVFGIQQEKALEILIQTYQVTLIGMADKLVGYLKQTSKRDKLVRLYEDILFVVESLLTRKFQEY
jgi:hypothetical protein